MHDTDAPPFDRPSKSQRKRDMHELQGLGERLAALTPQTLGPLPLSEGLRAALDELRRIASREARRRQLQYIGRLMRAEDGAAISAALERLESGSVAQKRQLHQAEQWRDRLLAEGDVALSAFLSQFPAADPQSLRQLLRTAQKERALDKPPAAARQLFRQVRRLIEGD